MKVKLLAFILILIALTGNAQDKKADTVIVSLAKTSKVVFTMEDRSDLELLKQYDFQALFNDILKKLSPADTIPNQPNKEETLNNSEEDKEEEDWNVDDKKSEKDEDDDDEEWEAKLKDRKNRFGRTWQSFNFDLGTNNYLNDGKFPNNENAVYAVRPWGSWYAGVNSVQRTRIAKKFFLEWGLGISWYNFKFEDDHVMIGKDDNGVNFTLNTADVDPIKSKLTVTYINASLVPLLDFGDHGFKRRFWDGYASEFRIGAGPYIGYRIASHAKFVYKEDGDREKDKERDGFYLNNIRYGARLQIGFRSTDLFFNYDLNELFAENKGPKLNAFSFGVVF